MSQLFLRRGVRLTEWGNSKAQKPMFDQRFMAYMNGFGKKMTFCYGVGSAKAACRWTLMRFQCQSVDWQQDGDSVSRLTLFRGWYLVKRGSGDSKLFNALLYVTATAVMCPPHPCSTALWCVVWFQLNRLVSPSLTNRHDHSYIILSLPLL